MRRADVAGDTNIEDQNKKRVAGDGRNRYLALLTLPFLVFLAILNWPLLGNHAITISPETPTSDAASALEATNRYHLFSFTIMLIVAALALFAYAMMILLKTSGRVRSGLLLAGLALGAATATALKASYPDSNFGIVAPDLFDKTLGSMELFPGHLTTLLGLLDSITSLANIAVALAAIAVALASCAQLMIPPPESGGRDVIAEFHAQRMRTLNHLLYGSAAVLLLGVLHARQWLLWPTAFLDESARQTYEALSTAYLTVEGLLYSLLLAAIYVPAALILHTRIEAEFEAKAEKADKTEWLASVGWPPPGWKTAKPLLSIAAPLLTGTVASAAMDVISLLQGQ